jgi:hypothetical protein
MKTERLAQVLIVTAIAAMAGAASFTRVHDWTMHNAPAGTGSWFGWANAVISELTPAAAGIEIRRRKRTGQSVRYPLAILTAAAVLSLAAQVSQARPTPGGWISCAVPALAFLALTKLILSTPRTTHQQEEPACASSASPLSTRPLSPEPAPTTKSASVTATGTTSPATPPPEANSSSPAAPAPTASPSDNGPHAVPPAQLLISTRMAAYSHQQETGTPITSGELATRMNIPPALAESLLDHLDGTPPPVTAVNGTAMNGSRP